MNDYKPDEHSRWRGKVIETMENLNNNQDQLKEDIADLEDKITKSRVDFEHRISIMETKINVLMMVVGAAVTYLIAEIIRTII